jgi:hypothetical protein
VELMYVRLSRITDLSDTQTEEMIEGFQDGTYPRGELPRQPGFVGYAAAVDREHGRAAAMSVWNDYWALIDSRRVAAAARAERLRGIAGEPLIDEYEIEIWAVAESAPGSHIRVSRFGGLVESRARAMADAFREQIRGIEGRPGYEGYLLGSAIGDGRIVSIGQWATREDLDNSEAAAEGFRGRQMALAKPCREPMVDRYEIVTVRVTADLLVPTP